MKPIYRLCICLAALLVFLSSCVDDYLDSPGQSGKPAVISVSFATPDVKVMSRADISSNLDHHIDKLWIGVYNAVSGKLTGSKIITVNADVTIADPHTVTLEALSGPSHIVAVANYDSRPGFDGDGLTSMEEALNRADTYQKFLNLSMAFDAEGDAYTDAPITPLIMSGHYSDTFDHDPAVRPASNVVTIKPGMSTLSGAIHLRRLVSQVRFNVTYNTDNIENFEITSWRVVNLPNSTWVAERPDDDAGRNCPDSRRINGKNYVNSLSIAAVDKNKDSFAFDFWMLENRRIGRELPGDITDETAYLWREREYDASESGRRFMSLIEENDPADATNNMATYVEMTVSMDMKVDENGNKLTDKTRHVQAVYTVHLGYCEGIDPKSKAVDFRSRRNSKYTYNVNIQNVKQMLVEARKEGDNSPGAEGIITDISRESFRLDAHYNCMNVYFSADELKNFSYYLLVYDLDGNRRSYTKDNIPAQGTDDYNYYVAWVEFRKTSGENTLASYKPYTNNGDTYRLDQMNSSRQQGWYTMFINEYVYEKSSDESSSGNWHSYVNLPDRRVWLNVSSEISSDGNTLHYVTKYAATQRSIQTYYNNVSSNKSALGVEHVNESLGLNLRNNWRYDDGVDNHHLGNAHYGRYNEFEYMQNYGGTPGSVSSSWTSSRKWSDFLSLNSFQNVNAINNQGIVRASRTEPLPKIINNEVQSTGRWNKVYYFNDRNQQYASDSHSPAVSLAQFDVDQNDYKTANNIEAIRACMNRNRDLDGDGVIDADEVRWYVPAKDQIVRIIMGRSAMTTPIFDLNAVPSLPQKDNSYNSSMLYFTSDGSQIWTMEGTSSSKWRGNYFGATPWHVRCVRDLGTDLNSIPGKDNAVDPAFVLDPVLTNVVNLSRYDPKSLRESPYTQSAYSMPVHHIYNRQYNRCYRRFEFADDVIWLNDSRLGLSIIDDWADYLASHNPCSYLETSTGRKGWRVPNQVELSLMGLLGVLGKNVTGDHMLLSCSYSYYDENGYIPGANPDDPSGSINSKFRHEIKAIPSSGNITQANFIRNYTVNGYYGVRCVRDYTE